MDQKYIDIFIKNCNENNLSYNKIPNCWVDVIIYRCKLCNFEQTTSARKLIDNSRFLTACLKCSNRHKKSNSDVDQALKPLNKQRLSDYKGAQIPFDLST